MTAGPLAKLSYVDQYLWCVDIYLNLTYRSV